MSSLCNTCPIKATCCEPSVGKCEFRVHLHRFNSLNNTNNQQKAEIEQLKTKIIELRKILKTGISCQTCAGRHVTICGQQHCCHCIDKQNWRDE